MYRLRQYLIKFPNTKKRVENTSRSRVFLTNFEVLRNVVKHCLVFEILHLSFMASSTLKHCTAF